MVDLKDMTPEQALKVLENQHKRAKERQRAYVKKQTELGRQRVSVYITTDAAQFLQDECARTRRRAADIVSDALMMMSRRSDIASASADRLSSATVPASKGPAAHEDYDEAAVVERIAELSGQGLSGQQIADTLGAEGFVTMTGLPTWQRSVVNKLIKKLKDE